MEITQISQEELDKLFETTTEGSPSADILEGSKQPLQITNEELPQLTDEELAQLDDDYVAPVELTAEQKAAKVIEDKKIADAAIKAEEDKNKAKEETNTETSTEVKAVLKNTVDYLIDKGLWADFEGRDKLDVTEEIYSELVKEQDQFRVNEMFSELLDSTGDYGKAIINHIKEGGNPDEIIDLFKEQKQVDSIDTTTEKGKQSVIEKYYKEVLGWKPEKVDKFIQGIITKDEVDGEFTDVKELYDKYHKEQLDSVTQATKQKEVEAKRKHDTFVTNITTAISTDDSLTPKEKQLVQDSILNFKHKLNNGQKVNDFYIKFAEAQADPKKYIKIVNFVMDMENYDKKIQVQQETRAAVKTFSFVKGNAAAQKTNDTNKEITNNKDKSSTVKGTNFSFALSK